MKKYFLLLATALGACSISEKKIVDYNDYGSYLKDPNFTFAAEHETINFWQNRHEANNADQTSLLKLAGLYSSKFKSHGEIGDIHLSDSLYGVALKRTVSGKSAIYQGLAENAITQHQFKKANAYIETALKEGDKQASSYLMLADIRMELGDIQGAKTILKDFKNKNSFAFLIRDAKIKDKEGKLDTAILRMEKGLERIGKNKSLYCWTKSNLGDMYGHAGRIEESYSSYLDVLHVDPSYLYALKGIAWIAFSHDHNYGEAKRIVKFIQTKKATADLHLLLAEIAAEEGDVETKKLMLELFTNEVSDPQYGAMYNKYVALLMADELNQPLKALAIAYEEINNRPTTDSYDLLAWSLYKSGKTEEALQITTQHVEGKTFEPEALYHLGVMLQKSDAGKSRIYLEEAFESSFELGPSVTREINQLLKGSLTF